jgi:hypothetical protein
MKVKGKQNSRNPAGFVFLSAAVITLYFNPSLEDPFNSPKQWLLIIFGSWIFGLVATYKNLDSGKLNLELKLLIAVFVFTLTVSTFSADVIYTAVFGDVQRKIGFLSYLFFLIYLIAAAKFVKLDEINKLLYTNTFLASIYVFYGYVQSSGNDFVEWNNPYNSIILTLGNPNFASAAMAISATLCLASLFNQRVKRYIRLTNLFLIVFMLFAIYLSNSRQGFVAFSLGISVVVIAACFNASKRLGIISFVSSFIIGVIAILGMLQVGPLKGLLYKDSVSVRGFYWRAGFEMFKSQPITGVGFDRYGYYFKEFREVEYPLRYGFDITSSNAHSVPIQMFATGGLPLGIAYVSLSIFILYRGIFALHKFTGPERITLAAIFGSWLSFQAQSLISIDNIGLTVWGWILGGTIIGVSNFNNSQTHISNHGKGLSSRQQLSIAQPLISGFLAFLAILLVSVLYRGEVVPMKVKMLYNNASVNQSPEFYDATERAFNTPLIDPTYKLRLVDLLGTTEGIDKAIEEVKKLNKSDPRNLDVLKVFASLMEFKMNFNSAIELRNQIAVLDPWDASNYLNLGRSHKAMADWPSMDAMRLKIQSFAPNSDEAKLATIELTKT